MFRTTKQTEIISKRTGKKLILEEDQYEFCEDIWRIIKEFAGIYNYDINWKKLNMKKHPHFFKKFIKFTYSDNFNILTDILTDTFFKNNEIFVRRQFWRKVNKGKFKELNNWQQKDLGIQKFTKRYVMEKIYKNFGVWKLPTDFQVRDEIWFFANEYANDQTTRGGRIISIAKDRKSYKIEEYSYSKETLDPNFNNSYDRHYIYEWDKVNTKISTIKSDKNIKKGLTNPTKVNYYS